MNEVINQNESALVCAARDGDRQAMLALMELNWSWLKGMAYNLLGNSHDVEEVLQDVCVQLISKIDTLKEPERFKPWLTTVTRNAALAFRQKRSRKPMQLDDLIAAQQPDPAASDGLESLTALEQRQKILQLIQRLPDKYREVFILKHVQDHSYAEIAEHLDIAVTTVQIRLVRARRMMQDWLAGREVSKIPRT